MPSNATTSVIGRAVGASTRAENIEDYLREKWIMKGHCRWVDPDELFVRGPEQIEVAEEICGNCPVVRPCLAYALDSRTEFGIWGGRTERQRRAILRDHPEVTSWVQYFVDGHEI